MASGVTDAVAAGTIDEEDAQGLALIAAVWVNPEARDADLVYANNREATAGALALGRAGLPTAADVLAQRDEPWNPYFRNRRMNELDDAGTRAVVTIERLQAAYADAVTRRDWDAVRGVFEPDAVVHIDTRTRDPFALEGPDALVGVHRARHRLVLVLRVHDPERHRGARRGGGHRPRCTSASSGSTATEHGARPTGSTATATGAATARGGSPGVATRRSPGAAPEWNGGRFRLPTDG